MSPIQARRDVQRLKKRRTNLLAVITEKAEERREVSERIRTKKDRDSDNEDRKADLHAELIELGREVDTLTRQIEARRKRRTAVTKKLKKAQRRLKKALSRRSGPEKALRAAQKDHGKTESPPGSNWGPWVGKIIRWLGYSGPVYWCGCAAGWWTLKKGGGDYDSKIRRGYAGYIANDARANVNGLRQVSSPAKAGYATLWGYEHIVVTTGRVSGSLFETAEGNTSSTDGSQSNGGMAVYGKWRSFSDADLFAEQTY